MLLECFGLSPRTDIRQDSRTFRLSKKNLWLSCVLSVLNQLFVTWQTTTSLERPSHVDGTPLPAAATQN